MNYSLYTIIMIKIFSKEVSQLKVKVKDIAQAAGVSPTAVSLVLNDKPCRLSDSTKERIRRVAREMKFQKENYISLDALGKVRTIGLVIPDIENRFFQKLSVKISRCLFAEGYTVLQCNVGDDLNCCYQALESLTCKNVDGIIVIPPGIHSKDAKLIKMLKSLQDSGVPMILVDRAVYSVFCDFITADNKHGGRIATEHLLERGHRKIGCIMGNQEIYTTRKRLGGYKQALASRKITYSDNLVWFGRFDSETGTEGAKQLLAQEVTAIFAGNDEIARGIYQYAKEQGLRIPEDISVVGFDNSDLCELLNPPLTSVDQNLVQMADRIAEVMLHNILDAGLEESPRNYYFTPILLERSSTGSLI